MNLQTDWSLRALVQADPGGGWQGNRRNSALLQIHKHKHKYQAPRKAPLRRVCATAALQALASLTDPLFSISALNQKHFLKNSLFDNPTSARHCHIQLH